jgi:hypothetical protein
MWTHEMPDGPVRRKREELYLNQSFELLSCLQILARSKSKEQRAFGEHWLEDYRLWLEHRNRIESRTAA